MSAFTVNSSSAASTFSAATEGSNSLESTANVRGRRPKSLYKVRLKHVISAQHKFCSRKKKRKKKDERLLFLLGLDSAAFVTHDMVIMVFLD